MKFNKEYYNLAEFAVDKAKNAGADSVEAYITDTQSAEIMVSGREPESVNAYRDAGIGLRILKNDKLVFGSSNDLSKESVESMVSDLIKKVPHHTPDEFNVIPDKALGTLSGSWSDYPDLISFDPQMVEIAIEEKIKKAVALEISSFDYSPKVKGSMFCMYMENSQIVYLVNSNGIAGWYPSSGCGGGVNVIAVDGTEQQSGTQMSSSVSFSGFDAVATGRKAAENAVKMLGAKPIESCELPLVIAPEVGMNLIGIIASMASAKSVQTGKSLLAGKLNEKLAADSFSIIDDGRLKDGFGTAPVDGEGIARQTTPIIDNGVLKNYMYDCNTAIKDGVKSTGNRTRGNYQSSGGVGPSNIYLEQGTYTPDEIISGIERGFYMNVAFGLHAGIDQTSGDFSFPAAGYMIEDGKFTSSVRGISAAGNLFELMKSAEKIGNDLTWMQSAGCPTFSVSNITIGGV